jgi:hypothetical protein
VPITTTTTTTTDAIPPRPSFWRINFSRVERQGDINWTWQPQIEWNPHEKRYQGMVNMHLPNAWGYVVFGDSTTTPMDATTTTRSALQYRDPTWAIRMAAMNLYAAQHAYYATTQTFTTHISDLMEYLDLRINGSCCLTCPFGITGE